jgi:hypothetical protein
MGGLDFLLAWQRQCGLRGVSHSSEITVSTKQSAEELLLSSGFWE